MNEENILKNDKANNKKSKRNTYKIITKTEINKKGK